MKKNITEQIFRHYFSYQTPPHLTKHLNDSDDIKKR